MCLIHYRLAYVAQQIVIETIGRRAGAVKEAIDAIEGVVQIATGVFAERTIESRSASRG